MATGVTIPNGYGIMTLQWQTIAGKSVTATCGFSNVFAAMTDPVAMAAIWCNQLQAAGRPGAANQMSTQWQSAGVYCLFRDLSGGLHSGTYSNVIVGTVALAGADQPVYSPLVVSKVTNFAGRAFRGRMYPPYTLAAESTVDMLGNIAGTQLASLRTSYNAFVAALISSALPPVLLHVNPAVSPVVINSCLVRPVVGIQRRRRVRGA